MNRVSAFTARASRVFAVLRTRDLLLVACVVVIGTCLAAALLVSVVDATRAREQATRQVEAQAALAQDARAAQSHRIDELLAAVQALQEQVAGQGATIAAQSQALGDLTVQLQRTGQDPITRDPAATRPPAKAATPPPSPGPAAAPPPSTAPSKPATPALPPPAPEPDPPLCLLGICLP